jgi:rRNA maturation endonuclease Nob1
MSEATIEDFRRWLQMEWVEAENSGRKEDMKRLANLEVTLQEALAFQAEWNLREDSGITPARQEHAVRLVATKEDVEVTAVEGRCSVCDGELPSDLDFCPECGTKC